MLEHKGLRRRKRQFLYLFNRNCLFYNCIKKTMHYAYGSEKVLPLSKKHLIMLEYILVSQPKYSIRGDAF